MHDFKRLLIWQRSRILCVDIYKMTKSFPKEENFGIINQIQRCAVSVPSNIAEGCGRNSGKQLRYFLNVSMGSLAELETQILISSDLEYLTKKELDKIIKEINELQKMINVFRAKLSI